MIFPAGTEIAVIFKGNSSFIPVPDQRGNVRFAANVCLGILEDETPDAYIARLTGFDPPLAHAHIQKEDVLIIGEICTVVGAKPTILKPA